MTLYPASRERHESELSLADLRGDSARMAPHWVTPASPVPAPVSPALIHGVVVPAASARLIDATAEYGG
ncbi:MULTISPECIES: hypothetical protein [unclassified Streptomyces]|uniref:hypothetical protein n=1 Tax=unclassified Streptomyces TaxID=2593676 RepID=UPI0006FA52F7|nr:MULTISPECIES: hypothetical protein [unclassified Streptomyces]KQX53304.1 hypothetical protein ASD33_08945 [Streptomyces sp. Root1304]KRA90224.1 hypothetical protein ASE09_08950 [Streptomyces sp. Root66D1]